MGIVRIVSASQVDTFRQCPLKWWFRHVKEEPERQRAAALLVGTVVDAAVKAAVYAVRDGLSPDAEALFAKAWGDEVGATPVPIEWPEKGEEATKATAHDLVVSFLARPDLTAWVGRIEAVDVRIDLPVVDPRTGREVPDLRIVGIMDLVERDEHGKVRPLELKTAASRAGYDADSLTRHLQLCLYSDALRRMRPNSADEVAVDVGLKLKTVTWERRVVTLSDGARRRAVMTVLGVARAMAAGNIFPVTSWACSGCAYEEPCQRWQDSPYALRVVDPFTA